MDVSLCSAISLKRSGGAMGILSTKVPSNGSSLENLFCPTSGIDLLTTAACRLAGIARGVVRGGGLTGGAKA